MVTVSPITINRTDPIFLLTLFTLKDHYKMHPIEYPINTIEMVSKIPPDTVPIINLVETNVVSKDYLSKLLTTYKTLSREEIISTLRLIVSRKERLYDYSTLTST